MTKFIVITLLFLFLAATTNAAELRIVDSRGLTRAVKDVKNLAQVSISAKTPSGAQPAEPITLTNVDGIIPDKTAYPEFGGHYNFQALKEGTWKIATKDNIEVQEVKIIE